jgi:site-specific recombinase XerD
MRIYLAAQHWINAGQQAGREEMIMGKGRNADGERNTEGEYFITEADIARYLAHLAEEERAASTIGKYGRALRAFAARTGGAAVTKEAAIAYKRELAEKRAAVSVNAHLAALNGFFAFTERDIRIKPLRIQRRTFLAEERELTRNEYKRLLEAAKRKDNERLHLLMQTICATGIRVSELRFITVEAARSGGAEVANKGKTRLVFLPRKLQLALLSYTKKRGIRSGSVFVTKNGEPLDRSNIWAEMKKLCESARVHPSKVFPHNLRHLFARVFYDADKDIMRLADLLGHSDVNTTRIYVTESGGEHRRRLDRMGLVSSVT